MLIPQIYLNSLSLNAFLEHRKYGALVLDTRDAKSFSQEFIKGAINIGLNDEFEIWVKILIDVDRDLILITEMGSELEAITRLAQTGYENVKGYLDGGFASWHNADLPVSFIENIEAEDFYFLHDNIEYISIDVRRYTEVKNEKIKRAFNIPLEELSNQIGMFEKKKNYVLFCISGYRSMIAASILKLNGINHLTNVEGGIEKIKQHSPELFFA